MILPDRTCRYRSNGSATGLAWSRKQKPTPIPLLPAMPWRPNRQPLEGTDLMNTVQTPPASDAAHAQAYRPLGLAVLLREATAGNDLTLLGQSLIEYAQSNDDPYVLLELSVVLQLKYQRDSALAVQAQALRQRRHYRLKAAHSAQPAL